MMTIFQRIDDHVNTAGLRASMCLLEAFDDFHPPRWVVAGLALLVGHILLLDLKGELSIANLAIAILETFL